MSKIAVLGSGQVGQILADGFLKHGHDVMRGSRDPGKLEEWKASTGGAARIGTFAEAAAFGEIVVLAVKGSGAESASPVARPRCSSAATTKAQSPRRARFSALSAGTSRTWAR
jgi:predicted dinucleotide-binding enzyme